MRSFAVVCLAVGLPLILSACVAREGDLPTGEPYLTGTITAVGAEPFTVRVEEIPGQLETGGAKAVARVTSRTILMMEGNLVGTRELRTGQRASLWFEGPVAESYPVQGEAAAIAVLSAD